jgi:hypothetical protein
MLLIIWLRYHISPPRTEAPSISIVETTYKGKIRPYGKTRGSLMTVPIAKELARIWNCRS